MLNKWRRLFHSSRVKLSFVNVSACWFLVSTYLIWILGSRLILFNNQSRATLWALDTCLIVGHGSSRTWLLWYVFPWRTATIRSHESSAGISSNLSPVSREMISDCVELWETDVCFLHIQLIGTNVWLPKMHNVPPEVDFESSRSPAKSESWNSPSLHCLAVLPTWQYCLYSHVWRM